MFERFISILASIVHHFPHLGLLFIHPFSSMTIQYSIIYRFSYSNTISATVHRVLSHAFCPIPLLLKTISGTKLIVNLCIRHNIPRLVYTSSASVTLSPYMGRATFSLVINQTESKAKTPHSDNAFLIPGYPSSKLRAETIVLGAHGATLANGRGECICVGLGFSPGVTSGGDWGSLLFKYHVSRRTH